MRITLATLALALALPGAALAQLQSGPNAPSVGGQLPPTRMPSDPAGPSGATDQPPVGTGTPRNQPARTAPEPGHRTLTAPAVPGARQPQHSDGITGPASPIPARPGARPDASTTGRDTAPPSGQGSGR
jgi:hypothetical protein